MDISEGRKIDAIKDHLKRNKKKYLLGASLAGLVSAEKGAFGNKIQDDVRGLEKKVLRKTSKTGSDMLYLGKDMKNTGVNQTVKFVGKNIEIVGRKIRRMSLDRRDSIDSQKYIRDNPNRK